MSEIRKEEPPSRKRAGIYAELAAACRAEPGTWFCMDVQHKHAHATASAIKHGGLLGFKTGRWDATGVHSAAEGNKLYVRFLGDDQP